MAPWPSIVQKTTVSTAAVTKITAATKTTAAGGAPPASQDDGPAGPARHAGAESFVPGENTAPRTVFSLPTCKTYLARDAVLGFSEHRSQSHLPLPFSRHHRCRWRWRGLIWHFRCSHPSTLGWSGAWEHHHSPAWDRTCSPRSHKQHSRCRQNSAPRRISSFRARNRPP